MSTEKCPRRLKRELIHCYKALKLTVREEGRKLLIMPLSDPQLPWLMR